MATSGRTGSVSSWSVGAPRGRRRGAHLCLSPATCCEMGQSDDSCAATVYSPEQFCTDFVLRRAFPGPVVKLNGVMGWESVSWCMGEGCGRKSRAWEVLVDGGSLPGTRTWSACLATFVYEIEMYAVDVQWMGVTAEQERAREMSKRRRKRTNAG